ncbi:cell division protein FtsQ [Burkholderia contaminans]|nr:cell division protein FtsQ [Burkholderia contaminans]RQT02042.1 cell division protein FtsQ [Burkholderia contaminans]TCW62779.1 cell division protein FtsQ [Burkholderia sp. SRS-25]
MKNRFNRRHRLPLGEHESSAWRRDRARRASWPAQARRCLLPTHPRTARRLLRDAAPHHVTRRRPGDPTVSTISARTYPSLTRHGRFARRAAPACSFTL